MKKLILILLLVLICLVGYLFIHKKTNTDVPATVSTSQVESKQISSNNVIENNNTACDLVKPIASISSIQESAPFDFEKKAIKPGWQSALVTNVDYKNNKVTFDYIQNVHWVSDEIMGGFESDNTNYQLRTFKFDEDTKVYSTYPPKSVLAVCLNPDQSFTNGIYSLLKTPFIGRIQGASQEVPSDFDPFVYVKFKGDVVSEIYLQYVS